MSYQVLYFNDAEKIIKSNRMSKIIKQTFTAIEQDLIGSPFPGTSLKHTLTDCDWRENPDNLKIIDGRRYQYKGYRKRVAVEASLGAYEYILEGLFRLQIGFDKGLLDTGVLILNGVRSDKSPLGESLKLVKSEIEELYPTISLPVVVALFDVGMTDYSADDNESVNIESADSVENEKIDAVSVDIANDNNDNFEENITEVAV